MAETDPIPVANAVQNRPTLKMASSKLGGGGRRKKFLIA